MVRWRANSLRAPGSFLSALAVVLLPALLVGCDLTRFTANSSAALFVRASDGLQEHWDYELVGDGLPASILQLEGVFEVVPDNEELGIALMRAYVFYTFGWIEDEVMEAQDAGDFEAEERLMGRARLLYERARNIGLHLLRLRDPQVVEELRAGMDEAEAYLERRYRGQGDVPLLFWTGYAWASAVNVGRDDPELVLDLPLARAVLERAVEIDPTFFNHAGLTFLGVVNASLPEALGGEPEVARGYFEQALEATDRTFFAVHVNYARTYAVQVQDRALFISLLREVVDGGDPDPGSRLANRIARRQAIRWLRRVDQVIPEDSGPFLPAASAPLVPAPGHGPPGASPASSAR
ncbi:MAG: TRAP transporter TatT component family protein [Sandaracinaceae bacterium]